MNWANWQPQDRANLCFVVKDERILLIRKKRGFGAGKINGPGGKIEPDESALDSAIRETFEELCVTPIEPEKRGELLFQFADGYSLHCTVFIAFDYTGEATETAEAIPLWTPLDRIPFDEMWEDDRHWLPLLLEGKTFSAAFTFEGESMTEKKIEITSEFIWRKPPASG